MFTRIVKMKFKADKVTHFINHFNTVKERVRNQEGCQSVLLLQDKNDATLFFTYSVWNDASDLESYRKSDFFKGVWQDTKQLFDAKPEAWSVDELIRL